MAEHTSHPQGAFCWADLATTDLGKAMEFYGSLFGWQVRVQPPDGENSMEYGMCSLDGKFVCGMGPLSEEMKAAGVPSCWNSYIATEDVDAWAAKAKELGGDVQVPPMNAGEFGRMAFLKGPHGEVFGTWQAGLHFGAQLTGVSGAVFWNELNSPNAAETRAFYESLCGWESDVQESHATEYTYFKRGETKAGGMLQMTKEWGETPAHWMVYFAVDSCDDAAKKVEALGGEICIPPTDIPPVGRFAIVKDTTGATFTLITPSEETRE